MFSFLVTVAEGAEGPSSLHNHTILIHHKQNYFIQHTMSDSFTKKTVAAPQTLVKIVSN